MAGHSIGGAAASATMAVDPRVDAGVNMDGTFFTPVPEAGLGGRPFLMLAGDPALLPPDFPDTSWEDTWPRLDGWRRWLTVTGAGHPGFTDWPVLGEQVGYPHPETPCRAPAPSRSRGRTSATSSTCTCAASRRHAWTAPRRPIRRSCSTAAEAPHTAPNRPLHGRAHAAERLAGALPPGGGGPVPDAGPGRSAPRRGPAARHRAGRRAVGQFISQPPYRTAGLTGARFVPGIPRLRPHTSPRTPLLG